MVPLHDGAKIDVSTLLTEFPPAVASLLPQTSRLWEEARSMLGDAQEATISVCQGKACCKAGSAAVLQVPPPPTHQPTHPPTVYGCKAVNE